MTRILVVGGNAAGLTAASRARRLDRRLDITVIEKSSHISYSTCGIPYFVSGDVTAPQLVSFDPARLLQERQIAAHTKVEAEEILPARRQVRARRTDTHEPVSFSYDRLLLATGVRSRPPAIPGTELKNVFSITNLDDAITLHSALEGTNHIAVIGGGYVGLEMAESLRRRGKAVTLYEKGAHVLPTVDPDMARIVEYELQRHEVGLRTSAEVEALVGEEDRVTAVKTGGTLGRQPVDAVMLDTGVAPNVELARAADIRIGMSGGITVSEYMETNVPGIFAAGNCAEAYCLLRHRPILHHVGTVAAKQGRVAGENLAGRRMKFTGTVGTTILKVFDLAVGRTGLTSREAREERIDCVSARIEARDKASYYPDARQVWMKLVVDRQSRKLVGAQGVGYGDIAKRIDVAAAAITASMTIDALDQLDLAYAPPFGSLWDPLLVAAHAVLRQL